MSRFVLLQIKGLQQQCRFLKGKPIRLSLDDKFEADAVTPFELLDLLVNKKADWDGKSVVKLSRFEHRYVRLPRDAAMAA